jgi:hypothetical protein
MATPSPMNRGYASGLAANRAPTTGLAANRAPMTGLATGAPAGGGFRSSFKSSMAPMAPAAPMPGTTQPPMATPAPMDFSLPEPPPVDFSNMFGSQPLPTPGSGAPMTQQPPSPFDPPPAYQPAPLPTLGQQNFNQPPPNPFGPQPLPFGGFRAEGGPVQPGQAYMVGERGPEMIVPQQPGMVVPNRALTLSPMNRAYGELPAVGENTRNMSRGGSLANRAVRQVGRSANDINRIAERMRRQGDPRAIMQLGMLEKNQQFSTARDDQNFERRKQMFDMGQQAQTARDQVQRTYQTQDQQQAEIQRQSMEEARRQWELQMYGMKTGEQAMRDERDRVQAEQDRQRKIEHGLKPVPVEGTSTPYFHDANGSIYSGGQPAAPPPKSLKGSLRNEWTVTVLFTDLTEAINRRRRHRHRWKKTIMETSSVWWKLSGIPRPEPMNTGVSESWMPTATVRFRRRRSRRSQAAAQVQNTVPPFNAWANNHGNAFTF